MPRHIFRHLKIHAEVPLFFLFFAYMLSDSVKTNFIIYRTCYVTLGYNKAECALLGSQNPDNQTANLEKIVEPYAAVINMISTLFEGCCSAICCLFVGPWSDRFGRKPILIIPLIGYFLFYLSTAIFSLLETLSPWYSLICFLPVCLTGGYISFITAALCCLTDTTTDENRGMRMGIFKASINVGIFLGTFSSSYLFNATGYAAVFSLSTVCFLIALFFTICFIPESLTNQESEGRFTELFQLSNISAMIKLTFKKRQNYGRYILLSCFAMMILIVVIIYGNNAVIFLFLREKFYWYLQKFTLYTAAAKVTSVFGSLTGVFFLHKLLKIPEIVLIIVSLLSSLNGVLVMGLARTDWTVYTVPLARLFDGVFTPMARSLVSKVVPNEDLGKIFSLFTACQFLFGMAGSPLYTLIYNDTIATDPGFFNFVTAGIYIFGIIVAVGVITVQSIPTHRRTYNTLINEETEDQEQAEDPVVA